MEITVEQLTTMGLKVLGALAILILGWIAAGLVRRWISRASAARGLDASLTGFFAKLAYAAILIFGVLAALSRFGIQVTSLVAILGAAGFAVGLALQGSLSNFAAGVMLLVHRPFRIGDYVEAGGVAGSVLEIRLFDTVLATPDNVRIIVPNGKIYGDTIHNYSSHETRRVDLAVGIGYSSSIQQASEVILGLAGADSRVLAEPAPMVAVSGLGDSSVDLIARVWVARDDYWAVKFDLTRAIKESFDAAGIEIPFPQRVVHAMSAPAGESAE